MEERLSMLEMWRSARSERRQTPLGTRTESMWALKACLCLHSAGLVALELLNKTFCFQLHNEDACSVFKKHKQRAQTGSEQGMLDEDDPSLQNIKHTLNFNMSGVTLLPSAQNLNPPGSQSITDLVPLHWGQRQRGREGWLWSERLCQAFIQPH